MVAVLGTAILGAGAVLYFFNPSTHGFYPVCEFHALTGLNCPGCGGTRAVYQLLHGHILHALQDNALFVLSLAALAGRGAWLRRAKFATSRSRHFCRRHVLWAFLVIAVVFHRCCGICRHFPCSRRRPAGTFRFWRRMPGFVFNLDHESDTSINNHNL